MSEPSARKVPEQAPFWRNALVLGLGGDRALCRRRPNVGRGGFTLLELVLAVTLLVFFVLPIMHVIAESRVRAVKYTQQRHVRSLAQQKLHDRIHYYEEENSGTFEDAGRPGWTWEIEERQVGGTGSGGMDPLAGGNDPILLEYTIRVTVPFDEKPFTHKVWSFPDERWYEERQYLIDTGQWDALDAMQGGAGLLPGEGF